MSYTDSKKLLEKIRNEFGSAGDVLFRSAVQVMIEVGQENLKDDEWYKKVMDEIDERHNETEAKGKTAFVSREFEKGVVECAKEITKVDIYDLLIYLQNEIYFGGEDMSCHRAKEMLKVSLGYCTTSDIQNMGFTDNELEELGYAELIDEQEM